MRQFGLYWLLVAAAINYELSSVDGVTDWWQGANFYQIYPRSFQDSDGDGVGDLNGITSRLEYLSELGVTGIWLSPIFKSPMKDFGYDISDYTQVDPSFGTMDDFNRLSARCKELNIKLILDFVPNHTSNEHDWFVKSEGEDPTYKDYYIWNEGTVLTNGTRVPPTNWISIFRGSAWTWSEKRQAYYYHQFLAEQPDLNYRSSAVVEDMKSILRLWMDRGVQGFRCDAVPYLFEVDPPVDEPLSNNTNCAGPDDHCYLNHIYTSDVEETFDMIYQWRAVTDQYKTDNGGDTRILMTEAYTSLPNTLKFYGTADKPGAQVPFNFELISYTNIATKAPGYVQHINDWLSGIPNVTEFRANWVLGNHDNHRLASRYGPARTDLFNILLKTLPGIGVTYNGEELGLTDVYISWNDTVDPQACRTNETIFHSVSRDPARTPFQWDDSLNAGFSTNTTKTWLPVAANYTENNVKLQKHQLNTHWRVFKKLLLLRQNPTFLDGALNVKAVNDDILVYTRELTNNTTADKFVIVLNLGLNVQTVPLRTLFPTLTEKLEVVLTSVNSKLLVIGDIVAANEAIAEGQIGTVYVSVK